MKRLSFPAVMLLAALTLAPWAAAQQATRYISDAVPIMLRSGAGNQYRIVKTLNSGTPVTVLQSNADTGWSQIETRDGTTGWVVTRFLMDHPAARDQLAKARNTIRELTDTSQPLRKQLLDLQQDKQQLQKKVSDLSTQNHKLSSQYNQVKEISANAISLDQQNKKLMENNQVLQNQLGVIKAENQRLKDNSGKEWFINGALAVGFGVLLALIIPRLAPRRKRSDWA